ncbi:Ig-like domain-containing protein [Mycoplasmatota bacterium zrk1]
MQNYIEKAVRLCTVIILLLGLYGCSSVELDELSLISKQDYVYVGDQLKLEIKTVPSYPTGDIKIKWSTSDKTIAKVDNQGYIEGISYGKVEISAKVGSTITSYEVIVENKLVYNGEILDIKEEAGKSYLILESGDVISNPFLCEINGVVNDVELMLYRNGYDKKPYELKYTEDDKYYLFDVYCNEKKVDEVTLLKTNSDMIKASFDENTTYFEDFSSDMLNDFWYEAVYLSRRTYFDLVPDEILNNPNIAKTLSFDLLKLFSRAYGYDCGVWDNEEYYYCEYNTFNSYNGYSTNTRIEFSKYDLRHVEIVFSESDYCHPSRDNCQRLMGKERDVSYEFLAANNFAEPQELIDDLNNESIEVPKEIFNVLDIVKRFVTYH